MENKVRFNLKNVHYAILTETEVAGVVQYAFGTPVHVPGAVNLDLQQQGELTKFHADGLVFWKSATNNGYEGDLEMARLTDRMMQDIWRMMKDSNGVIAEDATLEPKSFALLFQIDGDQDNEFYVMYNCVGTRPGISSKTNEDTKKPITQSSTISATPLANGLVMARTTADTGAAVKAGWFTSVYMRSGVGAYVVEYNANGGTGSVVDGNSPYASGATAKAMHADGLTAPASKTFSKWNTKPDGSGDDYDPGDDITVNANVTLYAIWA